MKGDELIEALVRSEYGSGKMLSLQLLAEVQRGYPARHVMRLIDGPNDWAAAEGAWILSEAGNLDPDVLHAVPHLVSHANMRVRYWSVDVLLYVASPTDLAATSAGLLLLADDDPIVRAYAIRQFAKLPLMTLASIGRSFESTPDYQRSARIATTMQLTDQASILQELGSSDVALRSAAMSAALRAGSATGILLERAKSSDDSAIERVANQESSVR